MTAKKSDDGKPLRIAFFTDTFLPQINGIVTSVAHLAEELGARGHQVLIFAPKPERGRSIDWSAKNVTVAPLQSFPAILYPEFRLSVFGFTHVARWLARFRPQVFHIHTPLTVGLYGMLAGKTLRYPLVGTNHVYLTSTNADFLQCINTNHFVLATLSRLTLAYCTLFYDACQVRISPSSVMIKELGRTSGRKKFHHLPNGIPQSQIRRLEPRARAAMRRKLGLRDKIVLHFGRLSQEKNVDAVLRAFALLAAGRDDVSLLVIGDGPQRADLETLSRTLKIEKRTRFHGAVPHRELLESGIVSAADLFVTASAMESQGMVIVEAMASGLPVVCVRQAAAVEAVEDNGIVVPPGDDKAFAEAMASILLHPTLAKRMGHRSLELADRYSVARTADSVVELYRHALRMRKDATLSVRGVRAVVALGRKGISFGRRGLRLIRHG